jgi:hypothetical protein
MTNVLRIYQARVAIVVINRLKVRLCKHILHARVLLRQFKNLRDGWIISDRKPQPLAARRDILAATYRQSKVSGRHVLQMLGATLQGAAKPPLPRRPSLGRGRGRYRTNGLQSSAGIPDALPGCQGQPKFPQLCKLNFPHLVQELVVSSARWPTTISLTGALTRPICYSDEPVASPNLLPVGLADGGGTWRGDSAWQHARN